MREVTQAISDCREAFLEWNGKRFTLTVLRNECFDFDHMRGQLAESKAVFAVKELENNSGLQSLSFRVDRRSPKNALIDLCIDKAQSLSNFPL